MMTIPLPTPCPGHTVLWELAINSLNQVVLLLLPSSLHCSVVPLLSDEGHPVPRTLQQ